MAMDFMQRRMGSIGPAAAPAPSGGLGGFAEMLPFIGQGLGVAKQYQAGQGTGNSQLDTIQNMANIAQSFGPQAPQVQPIGGVGIGPSEAMQKRMQSLSESPRAQLAQSIDSLKYVQDPAQRQALAKPLLQADYLANKGRV